MSQISRESWPLCPFPFFMYLSLVDVVVHICSILEFPVTRRAIISSLESKMNILHVSLHVIKVLMVLLHVPREEPLTTNQANRATITWSNVVLQQLIHGKGMASIHS